MASSKLIKLNKQLWIKLIELIFVLKNGTLKIIDRKKNLFKLSQVKIIKFLKSITFKRLNVAFCCCLKGEYISPEKVENVYIRSEFVSQVFVDGSSLKDYVVAIVVPDADVLIEACRRSNIEVGDLTSLCKNKVTKEAFLVSDLFLLFRLRD